MYVLSFGGKLILPKIQRLKKFQIWIIYIRKNYPNVKKRGIWLFLPVAFLKIRHSFN